MHNAERAVRKVPALAWDKDLAASAHQHASYLAQRGILQHGSQRGSQKPFGENLWIGTRGAFSVEDMIGMFLDERRYFTERAVPDISTTGYWKDAGHYSQIVWRSTTRVGCGVGSGPDFDVLVCRYDPAGNVWGQTASGGDPAKKRRVRLASNGETTNLR